MSKYSDAILPPILCPTIPILSLSIDRLVCIYFIALSISDFMLFKVYLVLNSVLSPHPEKSIVTDAIPLLASNFPNFIKHSLSPFLFPVNPWHITTKGMFSSILVGLIIIAGIFTPDLLD